MPLENKAIKLDDIITSLGEYCQDPDVITDIFTSTFYDPTFTDRLNVVDDIIDEAPIVNAEFADPLAPIVDFNNVNYKEDLVSFDARKLKVRDAVLATTIIPRNLHRNYIALLNRENYKAKMAKADPFYIPFEQWLIGELIKKSKESIYMNTIFKGIYNPAGTTSTDLCDGLLKVVADEIVSGDINVIPTGVIDQTNVIQKLQLVYDAMSEADKSKNINIHINPTIFDWLQRSYSAMSNRSVVINDVSQAALRQKLDKLPLDGTNAIVFREPGMGTSQRIICTTAGNPHLGFYGTPETVNFEFQKFDFSIKILMTFKIGTNFATTKDSFGNLRVNDQV